VVKQGLCIRHWREENGEVVGVQSSGERKKRKKVVNNKQEQEERERELAIAALLAGQRSGNAGGIL